jgi:prepilin signal peptidase PulO-like enzyme (type II secretory pathway)
LRCLCSRFAPHSFPIDFDEISLGAVKLARLGAFPFVPLLLAGAVIGLVVMALMWWTTSEA